MLWCTSLWTHIPLDVAQRKFIMHQPTSRRSASKIMRYCQVSTQLQAMSSKSSCHGNNKKLNEHLPQFKKKRHRVPPELRDIEIFFWTCEMIFYRLKTKGFLHWIPTTMEKVSLVPGQLILSISTAKPRDSSNTLYLVGRKGCHLLWAAKNWEKQLRVIAIEANSRNYFIRCTTQILPHPTCYDFSEQRFQTFDENEKWLSLWIISKGEAFFRREICVLPKRWEKIIASLEVGKYCEWNVLINLFRIKH